MRTGHKFLTATLVIGTWFSTAQARSTNTETPNISDRIDLTLNRIEAQSEACKATRRSASNKCGQTYIFPTISNHPDTNISDKINSFIEDLGHQETPIYSRIESWAETTFNKENLLSISYTGQLYGQANIADKTVKTCTNFNLQTGDQLTLNDVLDEGYRDTLPRLIFDNLETSLKTKLPGFMRSLLHDKGPDWSLNANQAFQLNELDLILCFDHGELSSETVGPLTLPLPYSLVENLIDDQGPLTYLKNEPAAEIDNSSESVASISTPPTTPVLPTTQPAKPRASETLGQTENRLGFVEFTCFRDDITHTITVVEHEPESPFICIVEYDKEYEQKVLWRSRKTKAFCHESAEKLVSKYENQWGYTCGRRTTLSDS